LGLTAGLAVGILILLWVQDELSFDKFHHKAKEIFRVNATVGTGTSKQTGAYTPGPMAATALTQVPGVKNAVRVSGNYDYSVFRYKDKLFTENEIAYIDPSLFSVFDFRLKEGNPKQPFTDDHSIIITAATAKRYFGKEDPVGKIIVADNRQHFTVSGVMEDFPENSSINYDILFPIALFEKKYDSTGYWKSLDTDWGNYYFNTYLQLQPGVALSSVEEKLTEAHKKIQPEAGSAYSLQPLATIHLYQADRNDAAMKSVQVFSVIALLILIIACINYVNLSTARALVRSKEISVRKIIGAGKGQLFLQFVTETAVIFLFVILLALGLIQLLLPVYNNISGKNIRFNFLDADVWKITAATVVFTLAASAVYPALLLSSFEPLKALKGKISLGVANVTFRKVLVIIQFVFSVALIIGTIIISRQMRYMQTKELGYDKEHVLSFPMREMQEHYAAVRNELQKQPAVKGVTSGAGNIVHFQNMTGDAEWEGKEPQMRFLIHPISIDEAFIPFFNIKIAEGTNFTGAVSDSNHFILNETAIREAGIKDPVGKRFKLHETEGTIIGVVKDFHLASLRQRINPAIFYYKPANERMYIRTTGKEAPQAITAAERLWKQYNPAFPFEYTFLDQTYDELYKTEQRTRLLFNVFAVVAILISCLGLLGLATYTAQVRTKEIGIRKVLGATVVNIIHLLAKDFILLVVIAIVVASPITWWAMNDWLQDFTYRIKIEWWMFLLAAVLVTMIALLTISFQAVRAALTNPVKNLRTE
ncbi:MAG: ABC transporter permease, partial [Flavisolibacter sp.]|nr:ABC transporter permease [Flavisolibacter sp.]